MSGEATSQLACDVDRPEVAKKGVPHAAERVTFLKRDQRPSARYPRG